MSDKASDEIVRTDEDDNGSSRVVWFLTGAIIGATAAVLYAPKSGKDTRQYLSDQAQKGKDAIAESSSDVVDASREVVERGRKLVEDAAELFDRGRKLVKG
jgi:gas vesicle protein